MSNRKRVTSNRGQRFTVNSDLKLSIDTFLLLGCACNFLVNCQKTCKKCKNLEVMVVQGLDDVFHKQLQLVEKAAVTSTAQLPLKSEKTADRRWG